MKKVILSALLLLVVMTSMAQRERNYVYLLDCTQSMKDNNKTWEKTKSYLREDIEGRPLNSSITVVPFLSQAYDVISFERSKFNWGKIDKKIEEYILQKTNTGICKAWDAGVRFLDPTKENYFYLLTDGEDNVDGMSAVCNRIRQWCSKYKNSYAFYVMLNKNAKNAELEDAVKSCDRVDIIDQSTHLSPFARFYPREIRVNTREMTPIPLGFSDEDSCPIEVKCNDPLFTVALAGDGFKNGGTKVTVKPRKSMAEVREKLQGKSSYLFRANLVSKGNINIPEPTLVVEVINKPERSLTMIDEEPNLGKATWYESFLFYKAKKIDTLTVDLKAKLNAEAKKSATGIKMKCSLVKGKQGFTLFYNGRPCPNGTFTIKPNEAYSRLSLVFDMNAPQGKRNFEFVPMKPQTVDVINGQEYNDFSLSMRASYAKKWNPLATFLFWLLIALLAAFLIWMIFIRPSVYPKFKAKNLTIQEPIYKTVKLNKCRKVVFSNQSEKQSFLNRLFTGRIEFVKCDEWPTPWEMVPRRSGVSIQHIGQSYTCDNNIVNKNEEGTLIDTQTDTKTVFTIS